MLRRRLDLQSMGFVKRHSGILPALAQIEQKSAMSLNAFALGIVCLEPSRRRQLVAITDAG